MRAEELINTIYMQKKALLGARTRPVKIIMPKVNYDLLEDYRRKRPLLADGVPDYFTQYALFGLPIYIDNSLDCEVMVV